VAGTETASAAGAFACRGPPKKVMFEQQGSRAAVCCNRGSVTQCNKIAYQQCQVRQPMRAVVQCQRNRRTTEAEDSSVTRGAGCTALFNHKLMSRYNVARRRSSQAGALHARARTGIRSPSSRRGTVVNGSTRTMNGHSNLCCLETVIHRPTLNSRRCFRGMCV